MTEENPMEGLFEAWFELSNDMGRAWATAASAGGDEVAKAYGKWTESAADMGRILSGVMAGDTAAVRDMARSWERWSDEMSKNLGGIHGTDDATLRDLRTAWQKGYDRMARLMTEQAMAQMRMVSRMGLGTEARDESAAMPDMPGMGMSRAASDYWMDHYQEAMDRTTRALEGDGDVSQRGREVFNAWSDFYSGLLKEVMATSDYARGMGAVRDAGMDAIRRSREASEASLRAMGMPTRSDMDEVHRALKELAMDVKELRSGMGRLERGASGGGAAGGRAGNVSASGSGDTDGRAKGRGTAKGRGNARGKGTARRTAKGTDL